MSSMPPPMTHAMIIDFHAHVQPGADHGCSGSDMARRQLALARDAGVQAIAAVSHYYPMRDDIDDYLRRRERAQNKLQAIAEADPSLPRVFCGSEVTLCPGLDKLDNDHQVAIIKNANSRKMGKKDILKIDGDFKIDINAIGYVDPGATVAIIKNGAIVEKKKIGLPERITNVIFCKNPRCITTTEQELPNVFRLTDEKNRIYRCLYCEAKAENK